MSEMAGTLPFANPLSKRFADRMFLGRLALSAAIAIAVLMAASILPAAGAALAGYESLVLTDGSMSPAVGSGALLIAQRVDPVTVRVGDVITFRNQEHPTTWVARRVVKVTNDGKGLSFQTKGDANATPDPQLVPGTLPISKMKMSIPFAGAMRRFAGGTLGRVLLLASLLPLALSARGAARQASGRVSGAARRLAATAAPAVVQRKSEAPTMSLRPTQPAVLGRGQQAVTIRRGQHEATTPAGPCVSPRMQRIASLLTQHAWLEAEIGQTIASRMAPIGGLVEQHERTRAVFEATLDEHLQPTFEYADALERNLDRLIEQLEAAGASRDPMLTAQFERDRGRATEVRKQAEQWKAPIRDFLSRESQAIDALLAVFDPDIAAIESRLAEQERDLRRMASGLSSDYLNMALAYLQERADEVRGLAEHGVTDVTAVDAAVRVDAERARDQSRTSPHLARVLAVLSQREPPSQGHAVTHLESVAEASPGGTVPPPRVVAA